MKMIKTKYMNRLFCILCITIYASLVFSQESNINTFTAKAWYDGSEVRLRWVPATEAMWKSSIVNGITIERVAVTKDGEELPLADQALSRVILIEGLKPISENEWDNHFDASNKYAAVAKSNLYSSDYDIEITGETTLADAFNHQQTSQTKYLFTMFSADQDWEVAQGVAMAFTDAGIEPEYEYIYGLKLTTSDENLETEVGLCQVSTSGLVTFPAVSISEAQGGDREALLSWSQEEMIAYYGSYDIERSTDNIIFEKVNDNPFVFMSGGDDISEEVYYRDSLPENNVTYYYRVRGRSPFGYAGPASDPISVMGKPARLNLMLGIPKVDVEAEAVNLDWSHLSAETEALITGYDVLRSSTEDGEYAKLNSSLLSPSVKTFKDNDIQDLAYYRYVAYDENDYQYSSISVIAQMPDSIAPTPPMDLSGNFLDNYEAEIEWEASPEDDVSGYKVYAANQEDGTYIDVSRSPTKITSFRHRIDPAMGGENVYIKIKAIDHHDNYSDYSKVLVLKRPDIIPPSKPNISKALPTPEGVIFTWSFSNSGDVAYHKLQRTKIGTPNWQDLVTIQVDEEDGYCNGSSANNPGDKICFTDSDIPEPGKYKYRLVAVDDALNIASSKVYTVTPYVSSVSGEITNIRIELIEELLPPDASLNALLAAVKDKVRNAESFISDGTTVYATQLSWEYPLNESLKDFMVYRMITGGTMVQYKAVTLEEALNLDPTTQIADVSGDLGSNKFNFTDSNLEPGRRYSYQVVARHTNGSNSKKSKMVTIKIP